MIKKLYNEFIDKAIKVIEKEFPEQTSILKRGMGNGYESSMGRFITGFATEPIFLFEEKEELEIQLDFLVAHFKRFCRHYILEVAKDEERHSLEVSVDLYWHDLALAILALYNEDVVKYHFHHEGLEKTPENYLSDITLIESDIETYPEITFHYQDQVVQIKLVDIIKLETIDNDVYVYPLNTKDNQDFTTKMEKLRVRYDLFEEK